MSLVSPLGSKSVKIVILLGQKIQRKVYQMMSCPHPKAEARRKIHRPQKSAGDIGTRVAAPLVPRQSLAAAPQPKPRPGEGRSLADKGVREKVRDVTPEWPRG